MPARIWAQGMGLRRRRLVQGKASCTSAAAPRRSSRARGGYSGWEGRAGMWNLRQAIGPGSPAGKRPGPSHPAPTGDGSRAEGATAHRRVRAQLHAVCNCSGAVDDRATERWGAQDDPRTLPHAARSMRDKGRMRSDACTECMRERRRVQAHTQQALRYMYDAQVEHARTTHVHGEGAPRRADSGPQMEGTH